MITIVQFGRRFVSQRDHGAKRLIKLEFDSRFPGESPQLEFDGGAGPGGLRALGRNCFTRSKLPVSYLDGYLTFSLFNDFAIVLTWMIAPRCRLPLQLSPLLSLVTLHSF